MILPINDHSAVEITLMLHPVFIFKIIKNESQDNSYVKQIEFSKVKAEFQTKFHVMTTNN